MSLTRRQLFKLTAAGTAAWMTGTQWTRDGLAAVKSEIPLGLQLWSVRHQCEQDLPGVLQAVAEMGYTSVELAHSYYGHDAAAWRELLEKNNLKSCGMHMDRETQVCDVDVRDSLIACPEIPKARLFS
ncbi:MAG: hypothetical protein ACQESR_20880 [Planctomycetota bacterium]